MQPSFCVSGAGSSCSSQVSAKPNTAGGIGAGLGEGFWEQPTSFWEPAELPPWCEHSVLDWGPLLAPCQLQPPKQLPTWDHLLIPTGAINTCKRAAIVLRKRNGLAAALQPLISPHPTPKVSYLHCQNSNWPLSFLERWLRKSNMVSEIACFPGKEKTNHN